MVKDLFESEIKGLNTFVQILGTLSDHGVDKAFVNEGRVDSLSGHEIYIIFEGAFKATVIISSYITQYFLSFILGQNKLQFIEGLL